MAKKGKKRTTKGKQRGWLIPKKQVRVWINQAGEQVLQQDYTAAIQTCRRILRYVPAKSAERAEALEHLGAAYTMLKQFEAAYQAVSQALEITPHQAHLWYNRGLIGRYTMRLVQAAQDFEKAGTLEAGRQQGQKYAEILVSTREMAESERALRGPDFTLDQLQEQQELFQQGIKLMQQEKWAEAEQVWHQVIEIADCLPQPQGNLGITLLMQNRYDQAEAAFKQALDIDPTYDLAQRNLDMLPMLQESGTTPHFSLRDPSAQAKVGLTPIWLDDD